MTGYTRKRSLALVLVVVALASGALACGLGTTPTPMPTSTPVPQVRLTAKEAYSIALDHATAEYGDVYLSEERAGYATIIHGWPRNIGDGRSDEWSVSFDRRGEGNQWVGIHVKVENDEVTYSAEGEPYPLYGTWEDHVLNNTVDVNRWNIDSPEAVKIAEEAGGAEFRLLMVCLMPHWQRPYWYIVFGPATMEKGERPGLAVEINATNGEVISTRAKTFEIY